MKNFDYKKYLKNNPLLKEFEDPLKDHIFFPELEDEFNGAMDAMVVDDEEYIQDIFDNPSIVLSDDYYEVYNAVQDGIYSEEEAVDLAKKWATEKLLSLYENKKPLGEGSYVDDMALYDDRILELKMRAQMAIKQLKDEAYDIGGEYIGRQIWEELKPIIKGFL